MTVLLVVERRRAKSGKSCRIEFYKTDGENVTWLLGAPRNKYGIKWPVGLTPVLEGVTFIWLT